MPYPLGPPEITQYLLHRRLSWQMNEYKCGALV